MIPAHLFQDELVLLLQQFVVGVNEVQVVLGCGVIHPPQLLQECFTVHADSLMHIHHVVDNIFTMFVGNLVVLEKEKSKQFRCVGREKSRLTN